MDEWCMHFILVVFMFFGESISLVPPTHRLKRTCSTCLRTTPTNSICMTHILVTSGLVDNKRVTVFAACLLIPAQSSESIRKNDLLSEFCGMDEQFKHVRICIDALSLAERGKVSAIFLSTSKEDSYDYYGCYAKKREFHLHAGCNLAIFFNVIHVAGICSPVLYTLCA